MNLTPRDAKRFESKLRSDPATGCILYTGALNPKGYGAFSVGSKSDGSNRAALAHRVAWVLAGNAIPDGLCVLHNCPAGDNPTCCNVAHLWLGTRGENLADMARKSRAHFAPSGLPFGARALGRRYGSRVKLPSGTVFYLGMFDTAQEASAIAFLAKNLHLYRAEPSGWGKEVG